MTLGEWIDTWLELYVNPNRLAPSTKACYNRAVRGIPDALRAVDLQELTVIDVRRWLLQVAVHHPRAAQLDRHVLIRALRVAEKAGMAPAGLSDPELLPQIDHQPRKASVLDSEQLKAYMAAAALTSAAPILLLCCCGLRRGEAMGARWENIDLKAGTLKVVGQRIGDQLSPLKTKASARVIALPPQLLKILRTWPRHLSGWVCDVSQQKVYAAHRAALAAAALPHVTLHGLRHSFATAAAVAAVPMKQIQGALGHAHYALTADLYADHLPSVSAVPVRIFS